MRPPDVVPEGGGLEAMLLDGGSCFAGGVEGGGGVVGLGVLATRLGRNLSFSLSDRKC